MWWKKIISHNFIIKIRQFGLCIAAVGGDSCEEKGLYINGNWGESFCFYTCHSASGSEVKWVLIIPTLNFLFRDSLKLRGNSERKDRSEKELKISLFKCSWIFDFWTSEKNLSI